MIPPNIVKAKNYRGVVFLADVVRNELGEYRYNPAKAAFQYRVRLPDVPISMVVIDVPESELRRFMAAGKPVTIRQQ